jgi:hypothetical protein
VETQVERKPNRKQGEDQKDDKPGRKEQVCTPLLAHLFEGISPVDGFFTRFWLLKAGYCHIAPLAVQKLLSARVSNPRRHDW